MSGHNRMDQYINSQVKYWNQQKERISSPEKDTRLPFVTISREYGCCGYDIAEKLAQVLNDELHQSPVWAAYDKKLLNRIMDDLGLSSSLIETLTKEARTRMTNIIQTTFSKFPPQVAVFRKLAETVSMLAANGNVIIVGRAGNVITRALKKGFHVRIVASMDWKIENIKSRTGVSSKEAEKIILDKSKQRESFIREFVKFDLTDPHNYDLVINNTRLGYEEAARLIIEGMKVRRLIEI